MAGNQADARFSIISTMALPVVLDMQAMHVFHFFLILFYENSKMKSYYD